MITDCDLVEIETRGVFYTRIDRGRNFFLVWTW